MKEKIVIGSILETKGYSEGTTREMIKEVFNEHGSIAWVNFSKGDIDVSYISNFPYKIYMMIYDSINFCKILFNIN